MKIHIVEDSDDEEHSDDGDDDNCNGIAPARRPSYATFTKEIIKEGSGPSIREGQSVSVEANLYLAANNTAIWSTHKSSGFLFPAKGGAQPFTYASGTGGVIKGWDDGVGTMKLGERATIHIPWQHAYGAEGHPGFKIGPKEDLRFEIEVLEVQ